MLITFARENPEKINDVTTLEEMLTFVRNRSGRPEAQSGAHDDCVMGAGHRLLSAGKLVGAGKHRGGNRYLRMDGGYVGRLPAGQRR